MSVDLPLSELLRWRSQQAELEAPSPPRAAELLRRARPWWQRAPEDYRAAVERLLKAQQHLGYAQDSRGSVSGEAAVAALLIGGDGESTVSVRITYFSIREGGLRLRFLLEHEATAGDLAVTFVDADSGAPLLEGVAEAAGGAEYRLEAVLPPGLEQEWERLRVTDPMPFRLILRIEPGAVA